MNPFYDRTSVETDTSSDKSSNLPMSLPSVTILTCLSNWKKLETFDIFTSNSGDCGGIFSLFETKLYFTLFFSVSSDGISFFLKERKRSFLNFNAFCQVGPKVDCLIMIY